jgi:HEAT repeat protein
MERFNVGDYVRVRAPYVVGEAPIGRVLEVREAEESSYTWSGNSPWSISDGVEYKVEFEKGAAWYEDYFLELATDPMVELLKDVRSDLEKLQSQWCQSDTYVLKGAIGALLQVVHYLEEQNEEGKGMTESIDRLRGIIKELAAKNADLKEALIAAESRIVELEESREEWPKPCLDSFNKLAKEDPRKLIRWINSGDLDPARLSFAAEALGIGWEDPKVSRVVTDALIKLLSNEAAIVREGAVYGLEHCHGYLVKDALQRAARDDESPDVQLAAKEALKDYWTASSYAAEKAKEDSGELTTEDYYHG